MAFLYLLRCGDGSLYTGIALDLERRLAQHRAGRASRYTRSRLPVELVWFREVGARVAGGPAGLVAAKPRSEVFRDAGVERAVAAAEDIDEGHAGL